MTTKPPHALKGLLIIANYNQEQEIGRLLDRVVAAYGREHAIVVDDGSSDKSPEIAAQKGFTLLKHPQNMGIGAAIRTGIEHAEKNGYDYVTISSSNGKIQPEEIKIVTAPILSGEADYVQGSRFLRPKDGETVPLFRKVTIPMFTLVANLCLMRRFTDITCGFRSYKLSLLKDPRVNLNQEWLNRYELEYYIHFWACRLKARIKEVPVEILYSHLDKARRSKIKPFVGWWSMIRPFVFLTLGLKR